MKLTLYVFAFDANQVAYFLIIVYSAEDMV